MNKWFVSTTRTIGAGSAREVEWLLTPCASEEAAKELAVKAIVRGLRVEAGTTPGVEPRVRLGWRAAHHWAQSSNQNAVLNLQRRLFVFAA